MEKFINDIMDGHFLDGSFHWEFPNIHLVDEFIENTQDFSDTELMLNQILKNKFGWDCPVGAYTIPDIHKLISLEIESAEFKVIHGIIVKIRVEKSIRNRYDLLVKHPELSDVRFWNKKHWGKVILFEYKKETIMSTSSENYQHNLFEYSLKKSAFQL